MGTTRRRWLALLAVAACVIATLAAATPALAEGDGTLVRDLPTGERMFITLAGHNDRRWNANGEALKSNAIHLDNAGGGNCSFRLDDMGDGWYAIKHIKSGGTDYFVDVDGASKRAGAVLHLWEPSDSKIRGKQNGHFAFYYQYTDEFGNGVYAIKNRNSGLWIGYDGEPNEGANIVQTTDKVLWNVTPSTYPLDRPATELVGDELDHALVQIFRHGEDDEVNKKLDVNEEIELFHMGTTNKWRLEYVPQYGAYRVAYATGGESLPGECWNVSGESGKVGATINIRSPQTDMRGNQHTSQLWRIWRQDGGGYVLQNLRSGLYVHARGNNALRTDSDYTVLDLSVIDARYDAAGYRINYSKADPWMSGIPDDALLSSVNIPGSHDAGTADVLDDLAKNVSFSSCQYLYFEEQLNVGARSFDIRCDAGGEHTTAGHVRIVHGFSAIGCDNRDGSVLTLENILTHSLRFLDQYPSETIILTIKPDDGSVKGLEDAVETWVRENKSRVYCGEGIPTMGEARGKVVLVRRFPRTDPTDDAELERGMGIDLSNWDDFDYKNYHAYAKIYDQDGTQVYVQDAYDVAGSDKRGWVADAMRQTTSGQVPMTAWVYNYTSCAKGSGVPLTESRKINPWLFDDSTGCIDNRFLGQVMLNFVNEPMCRLVYETNFAAGRTFAHRADEPASKTFPDVDYASWYAPGVTFCSGRGLILGNADGTFGVGQSLTRGQLATILWRNAEPEAAASYDQASARDETGMVDLRDGQFYTAAANWAVASHVINGYANAAGERVFAPDEAVTTEQLATVLANYRGGAAVAAADLGQLGLMTDGDEVSPWARQSVAWARQAGLMGGYVNPDGTRTLRPQEPMPRERVATVLMNAGTLV